MQQLDAKGITQHAKNVCPKHRSTKQVFKVHQTHEGTVLQIQTRLVVKEGVGPAPQGQVLKNKYKYQAGDDKQE